MRASQDIMREIDRLYSAYEKEVLLAKEKGFPDNTVRTYLLQSGNFVNGVAAILFQVIKMHRKQINILYNLSFSLCL